MAAEKIPPANFVIKDFYDVGRAIAYMHRHHAAACEDGKPLVVTIKPETKDRTKDQNRLYWMYLTQWAKKQGTDKDYEHNFFKRTLLARIYHRDDVAEYRNTYNAVKQLRDEKHPLYAQLADSVTMLTTTTDASTAQFTEYLNDIHAFCLKHGCYLHTPDDLKFAIE